MPPTSSSREYRCHFHNQSQVIDEDAPRYIILQGLSGTASGFLQAVPLALYYLKLFVLGSTPRGVYNIKYGTRSVSFGTLFPSTTLLLVISKCGAHI